MYNNMKKKKKKKKYVSDALQCIVYMNNYYDNMLIMKRLKERSKTKLVIIDCQWKFDQSKNMFAGTTLSKRMSDDNVISNICSNVNWNMKQYKIEGRDLNVVLVNPNLQKNNVFLITTLLSKKFGVQLDKVFSCKKFQNDHWDMYRLLSPSMNMFEQTKENDMSFLLPSKMAITPCIPVDFKKYSVKLLSDVNLLYVFFADSLFSKVNGFLLGKRFVRMDAVQEVSSVKRDNGNPIKKFIVYPKFDNDGVDNKCVMVFLSGYNGIIFWLHKKSIMVRLDLKITMQKYFAAVVQLFTEAMAVPVGYLAVEGEVVYFYMTGYTGLYDSGNIEEVLKFMWDRISNLCNDSVICGMYTIFKLFDKFHFVLPTLLVNEQQLNICKEKDYTEVLALAQISYKIPANGIKWL